MPLPSRSVRALARPAALVAALAVAAPPARAQAPGAVAFGSVEPEARLDALLAEHRQAYHLGLGAFRSVGRAVRLGVVGAGGVAERDGDGEGAVAAARAEVVARFTLQTNDAGRPRLYVGAGAGAAWTEGESGRGVVHLLVGGEIAGRRWRRAVEVGLGDGVRVGVVLRRAR